MTVSNRTIGFFLATIALLVTGVGAMVATRLQGTGRSAEATSPPAYWTVPDFALDDHVGGKLSATDLAGSVWLASFVYTRCPDFCPLVTQRMAQLRDTLAADGLLGTRVRMVSITVDPAHDTPEVLREYAAAFDGLDPAEWVFLSGEPEVVRALIEEGFRLPASVAGGHDPTAASHDHGAATGDYTVLHSDRIALIDSSGRVRGFYSATDPVDQDRLEHHLRAVLREP